MENENWSVPYARHAETNQAILGHTSSRQDPSQSHNENSRTAETEDLPPPPGLLPQHLQIPSRNTSESTQYSLGDGSQVPGRFMLPILYQQFSEHSIPAHRTPQEASTSHAQHSTPGLPLHHSHPCEGSEIHDHSSPPEPASEYTGPPWLAPTLQYHRSQRRYEDPRKKSDFWRQGGAGQCDVDEDVRIERQC